MATQREFLNSVMFSGYLDGMSKGRAEAFLNHLAHHIPKYVYMLKKEVGSPPVLQNTRIYVDKRYETDKVGKYTVLHCIESQMRVTHGLCKKMAEEVLKSAIDTYDEEHK